MQENRAWRWLDRAREAALGRRRWWGYGLCLVLVAGALGWWWLPYAYPLPDLLLEERAPSLQFLARDGSPLRWLLDAEGQRSTADLAFAELPPLLRAATIAVEDRRFLQHGGMDYLALVRATLTNLRRQRVVSGASTLAQQLIKISQPKSSQRGLAVKWREAQTARHLLRKWSHEQVLAAYLSWVNYGNLLVGCEMAAWGYFNKPLGDLSLAECALLAGLPQSPSRLNPFRFPAAAKKRQEHVLARLLVEGVIDQVQHDLAQRQPLRYAPFRGGFEAPHAVALLQSKGTEQRAGPLRTTLDAALQRRLEQVLVARLAPLRERQVTQAAAVILDNATGDVLALAGSRDFFADEAGQVNGAWTPQSPGSALKPFTYLLALERGHSPVAVVADLPIAFPTPTGLYRPVNYDHRLYGPVTLRTALGNSLNIAAVRLLDQIGGAPTLLAGLQKLGLSTLTEPAEHYGLGLTIGNAPVRLLELTNAYASLARLGLHRPWRLLADAPRVPQQPLFAPQHAFIIADMLSDPQARLLTFGAQSPLRLPFRAAVKTGTSSSYRDNWTLGYTPEITIGVWVGNFDRTPMQGVSGVTGAAPIWNDLFLVVQETHRMTWFEPPPGLRSIQIDPRTGHRLTAQSPPDVRLVRSEWVLEGSLPREARASDYDEKGRAWLPPEYAEWVASRDNHFADWVAIAPAAAAVGHGGDNALRILQPLAESVYHLDPDLPDQGRRLALRSSLDGQGAVIWSSQTLTLQQEREAWVAILTEGEHWLRCQPAAAGSAASVSVCIRVVQD